MAEAHPSRRFSFRRISITIAGALLGLFVNAVVSDMVFPQQYVKGFVPGSQVRDATAFGIGCLIVGTIAGAAVAYLDDRIRVKHDPRPPA